MEDFALDRTQFSVVRLTDPDDTAAVEERLRTLELLRRTFHGSSTTERIQRVLEVVNLERL